MVVELRDVCHVYQRGTKDLSVLKDLNLSLARGEFVAIMGKSGAGKSTLLHILGCLQQPSSGSYCLNGEELTMAGERRLARIRSRHIGQVFQMFHLLPELDVAQNVALPFLYNNREEEEVRTRVFEAVRQVGLLDRISHKPAELSGGELQRTAIARVLAQNPDLVLADEPTGNLDEQSGRDILKLFEKMNAGGHTIILVTHDPEVAACAQKIFVLSNGSLHQS